MKLRTGFCFPIATLIGTWLAILLAILTTLSGFAAAAFGDRAQDPAREAGLRQTEIVAAHSVSRSVLAAQKSERDAAEQVGLVALGQELKRLQKSLRDLKVVRAGTARIELTASAPAATGRPLRIAATRVEPLKRAHREMLKKKKALRRKLAALHAPRQRILAQALLQRLDEMEPMFASAVSPVTSGKTPSMDSLEALSAELAAPQDAHVFRAAAPLAPMMTTRIQHRREIPHVQ